MADDDDDSPESWIWVPAKQADKFLNLTNTTWPFPNILKEEFYPTVARMTIVKAKIYRFQSYYGIVTSVLGMMFSICMICTVHRKATRERNTFFGGMLCIACIDLVFHLLDLPYSIWYKVFKGDGYSNLEAMYVMAVVKGLLYSTSLASDICVLGLGIERYVAVSRPSFLHNLSSIAKWRMNMLLIILIIVISSTRMHHTMILDVERIGNQYRYTYSELGRTSFVLGLTLISDMVLPFTLAIVLFALSISFCILIIKRHQSKELQKRRRKNLVSSFSVNCTTTWTTRVTRLNLVNDTLSRLISERTDQLCVVKLTLSLDAMFLLYQISRCAFSVIELVEATQYLRYDSNYQQLAAWIYLQDVRNYVAMTLVILERMTRAMSFPLYVALSSTIRKEVIAFLRALCKSSA